MQETPAALLDQLVYTDDFLTSSKSPDLGADGQPFLGLAAFADDAFFFAEEERPSKRPLDDEGHNDHVEVVEDASWLNLDLSHSTSLPLKNKLASKDNYDDSDVPINLNKSHNDAASCDRPVFSDFQKIDSHWMEQGRNPCNHFSAYYGIEKVKNAKLRKVTRYGNQVKLDPKSLETEFSSKPSIPDLSNVPKFPVPPGAEKSLKQAGLSLSQIDLLSALIAQHQASIIETIELNQVSNSKDLFQAISSGLRLSSLTQQNLARSQNVRTSVMQQDSVAHKIETNSSIVKSPGSLIGLSHGSTWSDSEQQMPVSSLNAVGQEKRRSRLKASTRFRNKKKGQLAQLNELLRNFEIKIEKLESENRLLKKLIIDKGNQASDEMLKLLKKRENFFNDK